MARRFHKMQGLGNDFVIFDARDERLEMDETRARALADRRTGIGCDQLIILEPSDAADLRMRIFNADGGEVEACGNASRCVVALLGSDCSIETAGGLLRGSPGAEAASVEMGEPRFGWDEIPLAYPMSAAALPLAWEELEQPFALNVGNPHVVFFVDDADAVDLERLGPLIETDPVFPQRINVNVAERTGDELKVRTWERGVGLTRACGTGACASAVAAIRRRLARSPVTVELPGGTLIIEWEPGATIRMTGAAAYVFSGEIELDQVA